VVVATGVGNALTQPLDPTNASGVATATLSATTAEDKLVTASISGVTIAPTGAVTVTAAAADHLAFTVQPADTKQAEIMAPAVEVTVRDGFGNTVRAFTDAVTLTITPLTGTPLAVLSGGGPIGAVLGVATFANLSIDLFGVGYRLDAAAAGLTGSTSDPFNVLIFP
jgi:hypothetical protein